MTGLCTAHFVIKITKVKKYVKFDALPASIVTLARFVTT